MTIGEKIKDRRISMGIFQRQLAEELGVTQTAVSSWEKGRTVPNASIIPALCRALDVPPEFFSDSAAEGSAPPSPDGELVVMTHKQYKEFLDTAINDFTREFTAQFSEAMSQSITPELVSTAELRKAYHALNPRGQQEAVRRVKELALVPEYQAESEGD